MLSTFPLYMYMYCSSTAMKYYLFKRQIFVLLIKIICTLHSGHMTSAGCCTLAPDERAANEIVCVRNVL